MHRTLYGALICLLISLACPARASTPDNKHMVIIGASYAEGWHPPLPGYTVINNAVCGQVTSAMLAHFQRDVIELKPDTVLIWGHNNDVMRSAPENMAATRKKAQDNYRAMIEQARAADITPILVTEITLPIPDTLKERLMSLIEGLRGKADYRVRINTEIKAMNAWLRDYARTEHIKLLDLEKALDSGNGTRRAEYALPDHSHVTDAGYAAINKYVLSQLG